ncbi:MAG: hypothetical protein KDD55_08700 [Bdellovibrionales bacterium]|nr:hypothetical protein [Bdellovibrionales bacterium]
MHSFFQTITVLFFVLLSGCSTHRTLTDAALQNGPKLSLHNENCSWWTSRFLLSEPGSIPHWELDPLIADQVLHPLLENFEENIPYWRIHRRAAQDATGHQLSFHFYTTPETAQKLTEEINGSPLLASLWEAKLLRKVIHDDPKAPSSSNFSATSAPHWSPTLQLAWPAFMMGASMTWLSLVHQRAQEREVSPSSNLETLQQLYQEVERKVALSWSREGQHAFFHHLSALFGYHPMVLKKEIVF